mmetsp:Transcript_51606/g.110249  ORF Transcript_51606/g.110249 Transcript_51606/m.110249 type:complete len:143 (-) Transcript_51606:129-557(-)
MGYRQLHRGSDYRRKLEDSACGWRRVKTSEHDDKVNFGPLKRAWHSDLLSTEDNQNKDTVRASAQPPLSPHHSLMSMRSQIRVFLGVAPEMQELLYDFHARRAPVCSLRAAVQLVRDSEYATEIASSSKTATRPEGVVIGRR